MNNNYEIEWIGTGSGLNPVLGNTSYIIRSNERNVLVDCGSTVPIELVKKGIIKDITDVIVTHTHSDHIGGLEGFAFLNYFAFRKRDEKRPNLYVANEQFAKDLWEYSLKGGMEKAQSDENAPLIMKLESYFNVITGENINIPSLPKLTMFSTPHVQNFENYGIQIGEKIFYSGDTLNLPPYYPQVIFQDCQFYETKSDVHISYNKLKRELPAEIRSKTYLVHLGGGYEKIDAKADGFAGFVKPGDIFKFEF